MSLPLNFEKTSVPPIILQNSKGSETTPSLPQERLSFKHHKPMQLSRKVSTKSVKDNIRKDLFQQIKYQQIIDFPPEYVYSNLDSIKALVDVKPNSINSLLSLLGHVISEERQVPIAKKVKIDPELNKSESSPLLCFSKIIIDHIHEITYSNLEVVSELFLHDKKYEHNFSKQPEEYLDFIQTIFYLHPEIAIKILLNSPKEIVRHLLFINHSIAQYVVDHPNLSQALNHECDFSPLKNLKEPQKIFNHLVNLNIDVKEQFKLLATYIQSNQLHLSLFEPYLTEMDFMELAQELYLFNFIGFKNHFLAAEMVNHCPHRFGLLVSDKEILDKFTTIENCNYLNCLSCDITTLPKLPNCVELNCLGCTELEELYDLPNCLWLNVSFCKSLKYIQSAPNCLIFISNGCSSLKDLPNLSRCVKIHVRESKELECIRMLPMCEEIDCNGSAGIKIIEMQPKCKVLEANNCPELQKIEMLPECISFRAVETKIEKTPLLPKCETIDVRNNSRLNTISSSTSCLHLDCSGCEQLEEIGNFSNCKKMVATNCHRLINIGDLDNCESLDLESCFSLVQLPSLRKVQNLSCENCLLLRDLTALPQCISLNIINTINLRGENQYNHISKVYGRKDEAKDNKNVLYIPSDFPTRLPVKTLSMLCYYLLETQRFPVVNLLPSVDTLCSDKSLLFNISTRNQRTRDAGGVGVQLIASLCEYLFHNQESTEFLCKDSEGIPTISQQENKKLELDCYRLVGHILAMCFSKESIYAKSVIKTGPLFKEFVYDLLMRFPWNNIPSQEWHVKFLLKLKGIPDTVFDCLCNNNEVSEEINQKYLKELRCLYSEHSLLSWKSSVLYNLFLEALEDSRLQALSKIAQGLQEGLGKESLWQEMIQLPTSIVKERCEGVFSKQLVLKHIEWDWSNVSVELLDETKKCFQEWFDKASDEDIKRYLLGVTGKISLDGHPIKMHLLKGNKRVLPRSNTCTSTLHLYTYTNNETFSHDMGWFLAAGSSLENP